MKKFNYQLISLNQLTNTHFQVQLSPVDQVMPHQAGQYLTILYPNNTFQPFSIANAPTKDDRIELHIRALTTDKETQHLIDALVASKAAIIAGPYGNCKFEVNEAASRILIIAAGTGFAPAKAIIEKMIEQGKQKDCHLYWTVKEPYDFYLKKLPIQWEQELSDFSFTPVLRNTNRENLFDSIISDLGRLNHTLVYVFGPQSLAIDALSRLGQAGLDRLNFYTDVL
jgi:NAD(P)H-flavin reductase